MRILRSVTVLCAAVPVLLGVTAGVAGAVSPASIKSCEGTVLVDGSSGSCVTTEQSFLNSDRSKWGGSTISVDGKYGPATIAQVKKFQGHYKLTVDGVVGSKTWSTEYGIAECDQSC